MFDAVEAVGADMWGECRAAADRDAHQVPGHATAQVYSVLNTLIQRHNFNTAVSIISMPEVPKERSGAVTDAYMNGLRTLTGGIGPVLLTKAQVDSSVITVEL